MTKEIYLIAKDGEPKRILEGWRKEILEAEIRLAKYMKSIGAIGAFRLPFERPQGFKFPNKTSPAGWTSPTHNGFSRPLLKSKDILQKMNDLDWPEPLVVIAKRDLGLPVYLSMENGQHHYFSRGTVATYSAAWTCDEDGGASEVVLIAPDFAAAEKKYAERSGAPGTFSPSGTSARIPAGFKQVTQAELDLIFAQAKVARERFKAKQAETVPSLEEPAGP